jgi:hypothetical protein
MEALMPRIHLPACSINLPAHFGLLEEGDPGFLQQHHVQPHTQPALHQWQ